jgi:NAD-dependent deacetylase
MDEVFARLEIENPPICPACSGKLRPAVVFFGEALDPQVLGRAFEEAEKCDFLLAVGSSLVVYPAAEIPLRAKERGATLAIINKERTPLDDMADYVIHEEAGKALPKIAQWLKTG